MTLLPDGIYERRAPDVSVPALFVLLTRFNLRNDNFRSRSGLSDEPEFARWLAHRLEIFGSVCLPSVLSQVRRPEYWLLGFDGETREAVGSALAAIAPHDWIVPVWQSRIGGRPENHVSLFRREIAARICPTHAHVISTRLDNDDAINRWFLHHVEQYVAAVLRRQPELRSFWMSFPTGIKYSSGECRLLNYTANHFLSRIEPVERFRSAKRPTALAVDHDKVFGHGPVFLAMTREPMWLQNVHGGNVANRAKNKLPLFAAPERILAEFGMQREAGAQFRGAALRGLRRRVRKLRRFFGLPKRKRS